MPDSVCARDSVDRLVGREHDGHRLGVVLGSLEPFGEHCGVGRGGQSEVDGCDVFVCVL